MIFVDLFHAFVEYANAVVASTAKKVIFLQLLFNCNLQWFDAVSWVARSTEILSSNPSLSLSLVAHVSSVCRSIYNQLNQLQPVIRLLPMHATKMLVQAFISCHLDYCNSLLYGISGLLLCVQLVQNMAARLVTGI